MINPTVFIKSRSTTSQNFGFAMIGIHLSVLTAQSALAVRKEIVWADVQQELKQSRSTHKFSIPIVTASESAMPLEASSDWDSLRQLIDDCAVETGIVDLAHQHDSYLHGRDQHS